MRVTLRTLACRLALCLALAAAAGAAHAQEPATDLDRPTVEAVTEPAASAIETRLGAETGLPLPRFASVRAGEARLRTGPGLRYPAEWLYRLPDMPVQIVEEYEAWRKVRDWEGTEGWMHKSLLSGRRTALVMASETILRREASAEAPGVALLTRGVLGELETCQGGWCAVAAGGFRGWLPRTAVWGLLDGEAFAE